MATNTDKNNKPESNLETDFFSTIQDKLLSQGSVISSSGSELEKRLNKAISSQQESTKAGSEALQIEREREVGFAGEQGQLGIQTHLEGRRGFATQMVALNDLVGRTEKSVRDLDMRYQQLILQNDAAGAAKVADLQIKALEFRERAEQQVFSNLMGMAQIGLQSKQEARLARTQSFAEQQAKSSVALEFGIDPEGKSLEQIVEEAAPQASQLKKAELARLLAETRNAEAQAAKALRGDAGAGEFDDFTKDILGEMYASGNDAFVDFLKTPEQLASIVDMGEKKKKEQREYLDNNLDKFGQIESEQERIQALKDDSNVKLTEEQAQEYSDRARRVYRSKNPKYSKFLGAVKESVGVNTGLPGFKTLSLSELIKQFNK